MKTAVCPLATQIYGYVRTIGHGGLLSGMPGQIQTAKDST